MIKVDVSWKEAQPVRPQGKGRAGEDSRALNLGHLEDREEGSDLGEDAKVRVDLETEIKLNIIQYFK